MLYIQISNRNVVISICKNYTVNLKITRQSLKLLIRLLKGLRLGAYFRAHAYGINSEMVTWKLGIYRKDIQFWNPK